MDRDSMRSPLRWMLPTVLALVLAGCAAPQGSRVARTPATEVPAARVPGAAAPDAAAPSPDRAARRGGYYLDDGPGPNPPVDLASIPDATPRAEPLLPRTLRPYSVFGQQYTPMTRLEPFRQRGTASWYGRRYHGQPTSSGERYDMYAMTAAHPTLPIPSYVRVTHAGNGRSVVVRVNDRGPFLHGRVIDLSYTAAAKLGYVETGSAEVEVELITQFDQAGTVPVAAVQLQAPLPSPAGVAGATVAAVAPATEPLRLSVETIQAPGPAAPHVATTATPAAAPFPAVPPVAGPAAAVPSTAAPPAATLPVVTSPAAAPLAAVPQRGFWLQFGAFHSMENARSAMAGLERRLAWLGAPFDVQQDGSLYKVQAGPWQRREHAMAAAERVRATTQLQPFATWR